MGTDQTQWPYTTPSGHTYVEPTTYESLRGRVNDYAQAIIETWADDERPPTTVTWEMLGIALRDRDRLREEQIGLAIDILTIAHVAGMPDTYWQTDARIARACAALADTGPEPVTPANARQWTADHFGDLLAKRPA